MKILLVYPQYPSTFWGFKPALKFVNTKALMPPLGLLTLASMLEEHELKLVDLNVNPISNKDILWADYVFISAMITQKESAKEVINKCKNFGTKIVAGGPLFSNLSEEFPEVDHFVFNEGEITLKLFLEDLKNGSLKKVYASDERPDINSVPAPKWDLLDLKDYAKMPLQFSRGCPFDCEFCNISNLNGKTPRVKSPEKFIDELNSLYDYGWRGAIFIVDDNFMCSKTKTKALLRELIKWRKEKNYQATYTTQISINLADDDELLGLMQDAGFSSVFIGLESPSKKCLEECGKFHNKDRDMVEDIKKIHNYGMEVYGGFIIGFDHDDETIFDAQFEFMQETGIVVAMVGLLTALPGTKLYHRLKDENRIVHESSGDNMDFSLNFIPKMEKNFLINGYKKLLLSLYSVENYYERIYSFLKEYRYHNSSKLILNSNTIFYFMALFFKAIYILGIKDKNRSYFWKMFLLCLFKYPTSLPKVITHAIYFVHFENTFVNEISKDDAREKEGLQMSSAVST